MRSKQKVVYKPFQQNNTITTRLFTITTCLYTITTTLLRMTTGRPRKTEYDKGIKITISIPNWMATWIDRRGRRSDDIRMAILTDMTLWAIKEFNVELKLLEWARAKAHTLTNKVTPYGLDEIMNEVMLYVKFDDSVPDVIKQMAIMEAADRETMIMQGIGPANRKIGNKIEEWGIWLERDTLLSSQER